MNRVLTCIRCRNKFYPTRSDQMYCSKNCRLRDYSETAKSVRVDDKNIRLEDANELIELIANSGRNFFNYTDRENGEVSRFVIKNGRTYFIDGYTKKSIYAYENHYFGNSFTEGGTLQALVLDLAEFIRTGEPTNAKNGYGGIYCDNWGYPSKAMSEIQRKAKEIGFTVGLEEDLDRRGYIVE